MPPPELPAHLTEQPTSPAVLPFLPPFPRQPGRRPLPDAVAAGRIPLPGAVRRLPLPGSAPPYDRQADAGRPARRRSRAPRAGPVEAGAQAGAAAEGAAQEDAAQAGAALDDRALEDAAGSAARRRAAPRRAQAPSLPARAPGTGEWPSQFAQALAETLAGARPTRQITPWTTEQARRRISELGPTLRAGQRPRVRRVLISEPDSNVVEMTIIIGIGMQVRALAVRLERTGPAQARTDRGKPWICTAIEAA
jgi:hypothetical protein